MKYSLKASRAEAQEHAINIGGVKRYITINTIILHVATCVYLYILTQLLYWDRYNITTMQI